MASQDVGSTPYDLFYVSLQPVNSMTSPEVWYFDNTFSGYGWWHAALTFNELPYAGQSLRLYFHATTDSSLNTNFFLDTTDLHVQCTRYTPQLQSTRQPITVQIERVYDRPAPDPLLVNRAKK